MQATQREMAGTGTATFNDRLRDAVRGGGPFDEDPRVQGFASGQFTDPNGAAVNGSPAAQRQALLLNQDRIRVGLTGNLKDYRFTDRTGAVVTGADVDYNGQPTGYTSDPQEAVNYVEAHDNETLYDALAFKLPQDTSMSDRIRMQTLALSTTALSQGISFWHAGGDLLRSKSLDRNSYDSGDWFNVLDLSGRTNGFGRGLPPRPDNEAKWAFMRPLLADPALLPTSTDIATASRRADELLAIRASTSLFHLGTAPRVQQKLSFPNGGPEQTPGVIVMRIDDRVGPDATAGSMAWSWCSTPPRTRPRRPSPAPQGSTSACTPCRPTAPTRPSDAPATTDGSAASRCQRAASRCSWPAETAPCPAPGTERAEPNSP